MKSSKINATRSGNAQLRDRINGARRERTVLLTRAAPKAQADLAARRSKLQATARTAEAARAEAERLSAKLAALRRAAEDEKQAFDEEWRDLGEDLAEESKPRRVKHR